MAAFGFLPPVISTIGTLSFYKCGFSGEDTMRWGHSNPSLCKTVCYRPQTKITKVMFSQVSVCPRGGSRGACMAGECAWRGSCGRGACVAGGHVWQGGMCGRGGIRGRVGAYMADTTRYGQWAGGTHPTGMHSCYFIQSQAAGTQKLWAWAPTPLLQPGVPGGISTT